MIPDFDRNSNLPPGIYHASWVELCSRFGWNTHRQRLLAGLELALPHFRDSSCSLIYIDGSFVSAKDFPGDIDVIWEDQGVDLHRLLHNEPVLFDFANRRVAQKAKYGCEFFPASMIAKPPRTAFLDFFQSDRDGTPKGIVVLQLQEQLHD